MNPNSPDASRALAKLKNFLPTEPAELIAMAKKADDFEHLRSIFADMNNLYLKDVPRLP